LRKKEAIEERWGKVMSSVACTSSVTSNDVAVWLAPGGSVGRRTAAGALRGEGDAADAADVSSS